MSSDRPSQGSYQESASLASREGHSFQHSHVGGHGRAQFGDTFTTNNFNAPVLQEFHQGNSSNTVQSPVEQFMKLLEFPEMNEWQFWQDPNKIAHHQGLLWIKGKAGTGKSTMMKFAVGATQNQLPKHLVLFYFFDAKGEKLEKNIQGLYRTLLHQALQDRPHVEQPLEVELSSLPKVNDGNDLALATLQDLLTLVMKNRHGEALTCFVDALDECDEDTQDEYDIQDMITFFQGLGHTAAKAGTQFRLCFSSRHYPHITGPKGVQLNLDTQAEHHKAIVRYVDSELQIGSSKRARRVKAELLSRASGVFLWVRLVIRILNKHHRRGVIRLEQYLDDVPNKLEDVYDKLLQETSDDDSDPFPVLQWLYFAPPMDYKYVYFAIRGDLAREFAMPWDREEITPGDTKRFLLNSSRGLAEIVVRTSKIQLIHESVKYYLARLGGLERLRPRLKGNNIGLSLDDLKRCCQEHISLFLEINPQWFQLKSSPRILPREDFEGSDDEYEKYCMRDKEKDFDEGRSEQYPFMKNAVGGLLYYADGALQHGVSQQAFLKKFDADKFAKLHETFVNTLAWGGVGISSASLFLSLRCTALYRLEMEPLRHVMLGDHPSLKTIPVLDVREIFEAFERGDFHQGSS